jgi:ADP-dependent NAD(P)H-hydrate dehydratase
LLKQELDVTARLVKSLIVPRYSGSKKGDNGIVLIVGGNRIYHGAPILASTAALRCGTYLVYSAVPRSNVLTVRCSSPNIIALPLPDDKLTVGSANRLMSMLPKKPNSAAIGMGMTVAKTEALKVLIKQLKEIGVKLLLDASALIPTILDEISGTDAIVTPHPGEYKRMFGEQVGGSQEEQIINVQKLTARYNITVVVKGPMNIICDGHNKLALIKRSTPAMTVGGTGDVLSGLTAGFLSKMKPFDACLLGVYFNGIAASLAYRRVGLHMVATDLIEELPKALKKFDIIEE